ncbi:DeoR/GlpR family DNA-binding transcription regulator [Pannonibacter sp. SL95]|jgi:DeoR family glycerol-3-phosphate regulon repressor|uniref:DeoR/GlpR family DNA-binding transcription regulator n=1 Tax=Pannonibacter sp. SL95 TaxID=2995153 RepID=UPI002273110D|nr:DeoR/GlpR family DNA-binding transcription regulator [Pannonibacter sp. SL95]MCY1705398.1 DeoR/GlpR family DNA-binding transcription regulator [Pannonibacter sp. SL95]
MMMVMLEQGEISERQAEITDLVQANGFMSVESLAERFDVTTQTIRRDVNRLCDLGILRRMHGGVEPPVPTGNVHYSTRRILNLPAKRLIASHVASLIPDGASLAFSIGTTPEIVMQALVRHSGLKVFTNNLNVAFTASENPTVDVTIAGGRLRSGDRDILGAGTQEFFASYKVDFGIFGVAGVDEDGTLLDFHEEEVAARQAILANCRQSLLVLDHSKFGRAAHVRGGHISDVSHVVCDAPIPAGLDSMLQARGTKVLIGAAPDAP